MRTRLLPFLLLLTICAGCASPGTSSGLSSMMPAFGGRPYDESGMLEDGEPKQQLSKEFKAAQKMFSDPEQALLAYARMKEDNEEYAEARTKYRELMTAYPKNVDSRLGLARVELATGRVAQAKKVLTALSDQHSQNPQVFLDLGRMYARQDRWPDAIAQFEKACALKPTDQTARYELGLAFIRVNQSDKAMSHLTYAVGESAAMYNIGYVLNENGQKADAIQWFHRALNNHPDERTARQTRQMLAQLTPSTPAASGSSQSVAWNGQSPGSSLNSTGAISNPAGGVPQRAMISQQQMAQPASGESPFRTVSHSQPLSNGQQISQGQQMTVGHSASAPYSPPAIQAAPGVGRTQSPQPMRPSGGEFQGSGSVEGSGIQEPPLWRSGR